MALARRLERIAGVATLLVGGACLAWAVFRPTYTDGQGAWRSIAEMSLNPGSVTFLALMLAAMVVVATSAVVHSRDGGGAWLTLVAAGTLVLLLGTLLSLLSVGLLLVPALVGACLALAGGLALAGARPPEAAA